MRHTSSLRVDMTFVVDGLKNRPYIYNLTLKTYNYLMHLVICIDSNKSFLKQCAVMLFSFLKNNPPASNTELDTGGQDNATQNQVILHIIHTPEAKPLFEQYRELLSHFVANTHVTLQYYSIDRDTIKQLNLPVYNNLPLTTYFRLLITKLLDPSIEKCLYIDGDCIIRKPIASLYSLELNSDQRVAGVMTNVLTIYMENLSVDEYINAWVLLINLKARRTNNVASQCIDFIQQYPNGLRWIQPIMGDQCAINYICRDHITVVEPVFNVTPFWFGINELTNDELTNLGYSQEHIMQAQRDPAILHFAGTRKPCEWISFHPWKLSYYYYLFESGCINWTDFVKVIWHTLTYPLKTNGYLYQGLKKLRDSLIKK